MVNQLLVTLVNSVLGSGKPTSRNNYAYQCPFCNHHKKKLEINFTENKKGKNEWHCWVCDKKGTNIGVFFSLIKAPKSKILEAQKLSKSSYTFDTTHLQEDLSLPKEYKSFQDLSLSDIEGRHALSYLKSRKISYSDIIKYNIGYCLSGKYRNTIIIPSYDSNFKLNYFISRNFTSTGFAYKNPKVSKDIISNEHLINWNIPIILCEGMFDAIAIKRNAIPLLGKTISKELMKKLVTSQIKKIYIALDKDAIKQSLKFCEKLLNENKKVYLVEMDGKDASEMGFKKFTNLIQKTEPLSYFDLLKYKLTI